jgi:hypothetical protein
LLLLATSGATARAAQELGLGFSADPALTLGTPASQAPWISRAVSEGAGIVRVNLTWSQVAPARRPRHFSPAAPASPGYRWASIDTAIRDLSAKGLQVLLNITNAPSWAEGAHRPRHVQPGTWRPNAAQFAAFATAAARRYDGRFPDRQQPGAVLPRVMYWQAWNEPNLDVALTPQWNQVGHNFTPASPGIYRSLLNAFYSGVTGVARSNVVVAAGLAPYGNAPGVSFPGGFRMPPVTFDRTLFLRPVHLDVLAQNTYPILGPLWHAYQPDDVAVADLYKVVGVLHAAERAGRALPRGPKRLWVTELGWDSNPPNPGGVPVDEQARWYEQALYVLWRQGVDTVLLFQIVDAPCVPNCASTYQMGLYYLNGKPKPAAIAFRFPFVTQRLSQNRIQAWGRAPVAGALSLEELQAGHWTVIRRLAVGVHRIFLVTLPVRGRVRLRALAGTQTSLTWTQGA